MREIFAMFSHFQKDLFDLLEIGTQQNGNFKLLFPRTNTVKLLSQQELIPIIYGYYYSSICFFAEVHCFTTFQQAMLLSKNELQIK